MAMPTDHIIALLRAERDRLDAALRALEGTTKRRGRPRKIADDTNMPDWVRPKATPKKHGRKYTAAQRREASARMKARWAARTKTAPKKSTPGYRSARKAKAAAGGE